MIVSIIKIFMAPDNKNEILEILHSVKVRTEGRSGCLGCNIYQDLQDEQVIVYKEVWENKEHLDNHIRSDIYRNILAAVDMSNERPKIAFYTISNIKGIDLIETTLGYVKDDRKGA